MRHLLASSLIFLCAVAGRAEAAAPTFASGVPRELFVAVGQSVSFPVAASDPDAGDQVSLSSRALPAGASFVPATGNPASSTFSWTPSADQTFDPSFYPPPNTTGDYQIVVDAIDSTGAVATSTTTIHVLDPSPSAPVHLVAVLPGEGPVGGGTQVTIWGQGFAAGSTVWVYGTSAPIVGRLASIQLIVTTPASPLPQGCVADVAVIRGPSDGDTLAGAFRYLPPPAAPTLVLDDVTLANRTAVNFVVDGAPGAQIAWTIADQAGGSTSGAGTTGVDGSLALLLDLSSLADGTLTATATEATAGGTSTAGTTSASKDTTPPALSLPGDLAVVATGTAGSLVTYAASSTEGAVSCSPPSGALFPIGTTAVTCSAVDVAGNRATGSFRVTVAWSWSGALAPVVDGGTYRLGRVLPIKFTLTGASAGVSGVAAYLTVYRIDGGVDGTPFDAEAPGQADAGNQFRFDASSGQYTFNLATSPLSEGHWVLVITLGDGVRRTIAVGLAR